MNLLTATRRLGLAEFARMFGTAPADLPAEAVALIEQGDFGYSALAGPDREEIVRRISRDLDANTFVPAGPQRKSRWEQGWSENLERFVGSGYEMKELTPRYIRPSEVMRLNGEYVRPADPDFELNFLNVFRLWLFTTYLSTADAVHEFGCGTGYNLELLARLYPDKSLHGLDWSSSAVELVDLIGRTRRLQLRGHVFDFFAPDSAYVLGEQACVLTMCALEQTGEKHQAFVDFLLAQPFLTCVNVEPVLDLYDGSAPFDALAARYHQTRGYLTGYLPRLRSLQAEGRIDIQTVRRLNVGSLYHEGYSLIVWKPTTNASRS